MTALLSDAPTLNNQQPVHVGQCREAVSNGQNRFTAHRCKQAMLDI